MQKPVTYAVLWIGPHGWTTAAWGALTPYLNGWTDDQDAWLYLPEAEAMQLLEDLEDHGMPRHSAGHPELSAPKVEKNP